MSKEKTNAFRRDIIAMMPALRAFAYRFVKNETDASDLVQETLVKALTHEHQFQPGSDLRAWLFTIMRNAFITGYIRTKRERPSETEDAAWSPGHVAASQFWALRAIELQRSIEGLTPEYRDVVILVMLTGLSYHAAAAHLGCPVGTVKSRISRARAHLAEAISWP